MTQLEKLIAMLMARPVEADFSDVQKVLEAFGWELRSRAGSHATFKKPGEAGVFTVPTVAGRTVKRVYVVRLLELLHLEGPDD